MTKKYTARCACGACKFEFDTEPTFIANCHCNDCKKASGGEMATFFGVPADDFTLISGKPKAFHYVAESGKGLDRNFCPECGARIFSTNLESFPGLVFVTLGRQPRSTRVDRAQTGDVHQAPSALGETPRSAAVPRHAKLSINGAVKFGKRAACELTFPDSY
jgi:hypothetical protein